MTKETLEKILEKNKRIYNKRNHIDGIRCVTIEEEDSEMFEDLVMAAVNEAIRKMDEMSTQKMSKITGGLGGLFQNEVSTVDYYSGYITKLIEELSGLPGIGP